jgi:hypothetical protein
MTRMPLLRPALAGTTYFALAFSVAFVLGAVRVTLIEAIIGQIIAVMLEVPLMLAVSWVACRWVLARWRIEPRIFDRLVMGAVAMVLLLAAELGLSMMMSGRTVAEHFALYRQLDVQIGLVAQIGYGLFPLLALWSTPRQPGRPEST